MWNSVHKSPLEMKSIIVDKDNPVIVHEKIIFRHDIELCCTKMTKVLRSEVQCLTNPFLQSILSSHKSWLLGSQCLFLNGSCITSRQSQKGVLLSFWRNKFTVLSPSQYPSLIQLKWFYICIRCSSIHIKEHVRKLRTNPCERGIPWLCNFLLSVECIVLYL